MKILIADPHAEVQSALRLILKQIPEVAEVSEVNSPVQLFAQCANECPDLVLFDQGLAQPGRGQSLTLAELIRVLRHLCPHSRLVVMSSRFEAEQEALAAGANGYISKTAPPDEVLSGIAGFLKRP